MNEDEPKRANEETITVGDEHVSWFIDKFERLLIRAPPAFLLYAQTTHLGRFGHCSHRCDDDKCA